MMVYFSLGALFIILGVICLLIPFEKLQTVFRRMRSSITTKVGGAVLLVAGIVTMIMGLLQ